MVNLQLDEDELIVGAIFTVILVITFHLIRLYGTQEVLDGLFILLKAVVFICLLAISTYVSGKVIMFCGRNIHAWLDQEEIL